MADSPYSPYLTPTDFHLCGAIMQCLGVQQIATDADVKQADHWHLTQIFSILG